MNELIPVLKQFVDILGATSPVVYILAWGWVLSKIMMPVCVYRLIKSWISIPEDCECERD